ncbi:hypothetical protein ScalyP_jg69, partial [Parmales sp. scaly parma]
NNNNNNENENENENDSDSDSKDNNSNNNSNSNSTTLPLPPPPPLSLPPSSSSSTIPLSTYQGRHTTSESLTSSNGCSVIAFILTIYHIKSEHGVTDQAAVNVIDNLSPSILDSIRKICGIDKYGFVAGIEVWGCLQGILPGSNGQDDQFFEVGGNILDKEATGRLGEAMAATPGKSACAFYFCDHLFCITCTPTDGSLKFQVLDSLPATGSNPGAFGTRTTCNSSEALQTHLQQHAMNKFEYYSEYLSTVKETEWSPNNHKDCRNFQAFIC